METLPAGGSKAGVTTPARVSLWPVNAVLHQPGKVPLAGHAEVLFAVSDASETEGLELDCGLDGLDGLEGLDGAEGFEEGGAVPGKMELPEPAVTAEHADNPKHARVEAAKRTKDTRRLIDPPLRTDSDI